VVAETVYLGGPIDGTDASEQNWRTDIRQALDVLNIPYYDPKQANEQEHIPFRIVSRNVNALEACSIALFCFPTPGQFGFGSPIELWQWCHEEYRRPAVVFTPSLLPHVYLQYLAETAPVNTFYLVHTLEDAVDIIRALV
jgi:hypothetical protein